MRKLLRPIKRRWIAAKVLHSYGNLAPYVIASEKIVGWARGPEAIELARAAKSLPPDATVVEIGSFLGSSAVLIAGGLSRGEGGHVHCVDPFDASGDSHSRPVYDEVVETMSDSLRAQFDANMRSADVEQFVVAHEGTAESVRETWTGSIDMLFLDGDQSRAGARLAYEAWMPLLRSGGIIAVHNSNDRKYSADHDGQRRVVIESVVTPAFTDIRTVGSTTFAIKS